MSNLTVQYRMNKSSETHNKVTTQLLSSANGHEICETMAVVVECCSYKIEIRRNMTLFLDKMFCSSFCLFGWHLASD